MTENDPNTDPTVQSRRKVLGRLGGLAAALTLPTALARQTSTPGSGAQRIPRIPAQSVKRNPLTQYPRPPFPGRPSPGPAWRAG